jgi:hypothetical protein
VKRAAWWIGAPLLAVLAWAVWRTGIASRAPAPVVASADSVSTGLRAARLFFASPGGDSLMSESRDLAERGTLHERVVALVGELARGPRGAAITTLPPGTTVLHVFLDDRGLMTLDLSHDFADGFHGGSNAEWLTLASLVRTLGANLPEVRRVQIVCGGAPLATLGGHLPLDQPIDVQDWP